MSGPFTVLLTRPRPQAASTARALESRGYGVVEAPLIQPVALDGWGGSEGIGAIALTSRSAARLLAGRPGLAGVPIFAVGEATAEEARAAGAQCVASADGNVEDLLALLLRDAKQPVVHICGADHHGELVERLRSAGMDAERWIVYRMVPATALPAAVDADAVVLFSPRTARIYASLAAGSPWAMVPCAGISRAVVAELSSDVRTVVAARPREDALLDALDGLRADVTV
ncbi:MAG: uroporphyrinogen-III synthase [Pseudomonadota bacterium]